VGAPSSALVELEFLREDRQRSVQQARRAVRMVAGATPDDLAGPASQIGEVALLGATGCQPLGRG
jgi:hypothetical protein